MEPALRLRGVTKTFGATRAVDRLDLDVPRGATYGFMVGHISPEAAKGGPIAKLQDGDVIAIDVEQRIIETDADLASRPDRIWPVSPEATGAFAKYAALVGSASHGAVTLR